jgi:hypothetical protein
VSKKLPTRIGQRVKLNARVVHVDESPHYATSVEVELLDYAGGLGHGGTYEPARVYIRPVPDGGHPGSLSGH